MRRLWMCVLAAALTAPLAGGCEVAQGRATWLDVEAPHKSAANSARSPAAAAPARPGAAAPAPAADRADRPDWAVRAAEMATDRAIVYTGQFTVAVGDPRSAVADAEKLAGELGGYVQSSADDRITIRVPADKFAAAVTRVERIGQLVSRRVEAQDVTEQYVDLKMRLAAAETMLTRLQGILAKAPDAKQALEVEREIARVMAEVESLKGRIRLMENQIALSTLSVQFQRLMDAPRPALLGRQLPFDWLRTLGIHGLLTY